jgi:hypothetical protein
VIAVNSEAGPVRRIPILAEITEARVRNSSLVRIFGFSGKQYSLCPLRSENVALFSLNLRTLHENHAMACWLLSVHRVDKSIIFVEDWHLGWTYSSVFPVG